MSTKATRLRRLSRSISRVLSSIYGKTTLTPPRTSRVESTLQMLEPRQMLSVTAATLSATPNVADRFELSRSPSDSSLIILKIYHDNTLFDTHSYDPALASLSFTDLTSADSLVIDYTNGNPLPASSLSLAGGSLAITGRVSSSGGNLNSLLYRPGSTAGAGHLGSGGRSIDFSSLSSLAASNIAIFTFDGSADDLSPTLSADSSAVSLTNAANSINLSLSSVNRLALDLSAASDDVTLSLTGSAASSIATLAPSLPFDFATSILADGGTWNLDPTNFAFAQDLTLSSDADLTLTASADFSAISLAGDSRLTLALGADLALYTGALTLADSGTLDLQDNSLIVDYDSSSPKADLTSAIITGRNGVDAATISNWNGPGITSTLARTGSVAAGFDLFGIGIVDNAELADPSLNIPFSAFAGHYVDSTAVLIRYTLGGDTDNNGVVDGDDYAHLDNTYNNLLANYGWLSGDLNYDGNIDGDDYSLMDSAFLFQDKFSAPTLTVSGSASEIDEGDPFTLSFSATSSSTIDPVNLWSIDWGDGSTSTVAGSATSATHRYLDDSPDDFVVKLTAIGILHHYQASDIAVTVNNVAPTLTLAADATALEGTYNATFNISDPGDNDTLSDWFILWGDGQADWGDPATLPGTQSHTYLPGTYTLTLSATDSDGDTSTATRSLTIRPAAPTGLTASAVSPVAANLTWTDNSAGESAYTIQMSTTSGSDGFSDYTTQPANSTAAPLLNLTPDTDYWFRTNANSTAGGDSDLSNVTHIKTPAEDGAGFYKVDIAFDSPYLVTDLHTLSSIYTHTSPASVFDQIAGTVTVDAGLETEETYTYPDATVFNTDDEQMDYVDEGIYYGGFWFNDGLGYSARIYVHMYALQAWITTEDSTATEETSDTAAFTVHLSGQADQDVTLPFATSGQAIRGTDYVLSPELDNSFVLPAFTTTLQVELAATEGGVEDPEMDAVFELCATQDATVLAAPAAINIRGAALQYWPKMEIKANPVASDANLQFLLASPNEHLTLHASIKDLETRLIPGDPVRSTAFFGNGPYQVTLTATGAAFDAPKGKNEKSFRLNGNPNGPVDLGEISVFLGPVFPGGTISITVRVKDCDPRTDTQDRVVASIGWDFKQRGVAPTSISVATGNVNQWVDVTENPLEIVYKLGPDIGADNQPDYIGQTVSKEFSAPAQSWGFQLTDLSPAWRTANGNPQTADAAAAKIFGPGVNATFAADASDKITDQMGAFRVDRSAFLPGFLTNSSIGCRFDETFVALGNGFSKTYKVWFSRTEENDGMVRVEVNVEGDPQ